MLVVRCQNGVVTWFKSRVNAEEFDWICTLDAFNVRSPSSAGPEWNTVLANVATHSAGLKGAILQVLWIPTGA